MLRVDDFEEFGVLVDRRYDHDVLEIFRCGADQRDASDVDLLDDVLLGRARSDGLLERIEVDDHRVDLGDFMRAEKPELSVFVDGRGGRGCRRKLSGGAS